MNTLFKAFIISFCLSGILAGTVWAEVPISVQSHGLIIQIAQERIMLDKATVEFASIEQVDSRSGQCSIFIKLKSAAANQLELLTAKNIGKTAVISFNGKVIISSIIQSKLKGQLVVAGLTKEEAEQFINSL